jgi:hypothetical protein
VFITAGPSTKLFAWGSTAGLRNSALRGPSTNFAAEPIALGTAAAAAAKAAAGALWQPGGRAGPRTLSLDVPHHTPAGHRSAIARLRWAVRANVRNVPTRMRLCCLYICCSLLTVCVLLSASRDEEVVVRSQVLQPWGEFNCPRSNDVDPLVRDSVKFI